MSFKRTVAIDFDGVIHSYVSGWTGEIPTDDPTPGAKEAIAELRTEFRVIVFTCRALSEAGLVGIRSWLQTHGIEVDGVTGVKPHAELYVDDRAHRFDGSWDTVLMLANSPEKLAPWFKNPPASAPFAPICGTCGKVGVYCVTPQGTYEVCGHPIPEKLS